jgi:prepilin-type N-terminal cleavage/methylation domain-containing protein
MRTHVNPPESRGFTLLEVIIVIAVMAILAAAITPVLLQRVIDAKIESTRTEVKALAEAIGGRADQSGSFGFVGDMGRMPVSFQELVRPDQAPLFSTVTFRAVGMGWKGPYVTFGETPTDYLTDAFGKAYQGVASGQIRSAGPDGVYGNVDDIVYPAAPPIYRGRVVVTLKRMADEGLFYTIDPPLYEVRLYYSKNGQQAFLSAPMPPFVFENVPQGLHAIAVIRVRREQMVYQDTIQTFGGGATKLVEIVFRLGTFAPIPEGPVQPGVPGGPGL